MIISILSRQGRSVLSLEAKLILSRIPIVSEQVIPPGAVEESRKRSFEVSTLSPRLVGIGVKRSGTEMPSLFNNWLTATLSLGDDLCNN